MGEARGPGRIRKKHLQKVRPNEYHTLLNALTSNIDGRIAWVLMSVYGLSMPPVARGEKILRRAHCSFV